MKKVILGIFILLFGVSLSYAVTPVTITDFSGEKVAIVRTADVTAVDSDTAINSTGTVSSPWKYVGDCQKVGFVVKYSENSTDPAMNISVNMSLSGDDLDTTNIGFPGQFFDFAGGSTAQTIQPFTGNATYYFWLSKDITIPYVRIDYAVDGADEYNFTTVNVTMCTLK